MMAITKQCGECGGSGEVLVAWFMLECPKCKGKGKVEGEKLD